MFPKHPGRIATVSALALCLGAAACSDAVEAPLQPEGMLVMQAGAPDPTAPVLSFADLSEVGSSQIIRTPNGINYRVETSGLAPGHAHTLWLVIFNDPEDCQFGTEGVSFCGPEDVVNADANPDLMWGAGRIVDGAGTATFAGRRTAGDATGSVNGPVGLPAYGLENPGGAEIHMVVHTHGLAIPSLMPDMIKSLDGGCEDAGVPVAGVSSPWNDYAGPPSLPGYGMRGPNTCESIQFAIHRPQ